VAVQLGATVSGSDQAESPALDKLRTLGVTVHVGHDAANVPDDAGVFVSTAIPADNPERVARAQPRAELLRELTSLKKVIAIAGAHGKTTTSSMAAHALLGAGAEGGRIGYLIGGALRTTGENADWGDGEWLVVEADESDKSMLALDADVAVVLNIELDHHATYGSLAELNEVFDAFRAAAPATVVAPELAREGDTVFAPEDVVLEPGGSRFRWRGRDVRLTVPGAHNARNAAAALEAIRIAGAADLDAVVTALASFTGAGRRFERLGETPSGALVVDDYAHHPTEVAATIAAARSLEPRRLIAIFQPHLYSRTQELFREFGTALAGADIAVALEVYPARERAADFPGVSGRLIAEAAADAAAGRTVFWLPTFDEAQTVLSPRLRRGDLVLVLGAGDVDRLGRSLVDAA
jgi:UDP-N-acetylmuramate--alanine ligase